MMRQMSHKRLPRILWLAAGCLAVLLPGIPSVRGESSSVSPAAKSAGQDLSRPPVKEVSQAGDAAVKPDAATGFTWPSAIPADCPFPRSTNLTGVHFTGRNRAYRAGDTWYPSWADDGNLYSPWTDGGLEGMTTGPWRIVTYMKDFGEQGFFLNFPGKFISADRRTLWLCSSANFSSGMKGQQLKLNPPGGRGVLRLHEVKLLGPGENKPTVNAEKAAPR